jgi:hypothetical protein
VVLLDKVAAGGLSRYRVKDDSRERGSTDIWLKRPAAAEKPKPLDPSSLVRSPSVAVLTSKGRGKGKEGSANGQNQYSMVAGEVMAMAYLQTDGLPGSQWRSAHEWGLEGLEGLEPLEPLA